MTNRLCRRKKKKKGDNLISLLPHVFWTNLWKTVCILYDHWKNIRLVSPVHFQTEKQTQLDASGPGHGVCENTREHPGPSSWPWSTKVMHQQNNSLTANYISSLSHLPCLDFNPKHLTITRHASCVSEEQVSASNWLAAAWSLAASLAEGKTASTGNTESKHFPEDTTSAINYHSASSRPSLLQNQSWHIKTPLSL